MSLKEKGVSETLPGATGVMSSSPELAGQTVVVIGGSSGIGLETARRASAQGAAVVLTGRDAGRLERAALELGALSTAAFDATKIEDLEGFLRDLPVPVDHLMITAGAAYYAPVPEMDFVQVRRALEEHILLPLAVARAAGGKVRSGGTLIFMTGTGARHPGVGLSVAAVLDAALPALTANLALELAPVRVNLIAAGFVEHTFVGKDAWRRHREAAEATSGHSSRAASDRAGGCCGPRRTSHGQLRFNRSHL
jgi:NADP-dependent 3-hydroxy acid dehydrogenase YdfG